MLNLDRHVPLLLISLDLSSAFDTVHHSTLLDILPTRVGIQNKALDMIKSYLSSRNYRVLIDGKFLRRIELDIGVPQRSLLGPV